MPDKIIVYTDGGSRGNPGPAAAGFVLTDEKGNQLQAKGIFLGRKTNNEAEYSGLVKALEAVKKLSAEQVIIFSDSELLVKQINGQYRVKSDNIRPLYQQANELLSQFKNWKIQHVLRDKNKIADGLVNQALDSKHDVESRPQNKKN